MFLLDTHTLLWWLEEPSLLSVPAQEAIGSDSLVYVSAASIWEIETKRALGKLTAPTNLEEQIAANDFIPLPITFSHASAAPRLPRHHLDPFDRLLIAQAKHEGFRIVSRDPHVPLYGVSHLVA
jgi:PIN domain nuclease of toxin-antitoxin system